MFAAQSTTSTFPINQQPESVSDPAILLPVQELLAAGWDGCNEEEFLLSGEMKNPIVKWRNVCFKHNDFAKIQAVVQSQLNDRAVKELKVENSVTPASSLNVSTSSQPKTNQPSLSGATSSNSTQYQRPSPQHQISTASSLGSLNPVAILIEEEMQKQERLQFERKKEKKCFEEILIEDQSTALKSALDALERAQNNLSLIRKSKEAAANDLALLEGEIQTLNATLDQLTRKLRK